ncbi:hypothetical protein G5C51_31295 [Streptomyces sp. A7024]|uniref:Uncharacterized protein n=1 Tax=Streptomyces coryli TaxID=1128680 RepID=A0A6G4U8P1_9ACTN|nr:hypothetical protein [Streptomyces coryli]NGN68372.1 hypothetical protein [Streptomyces coryli]
MSSHGTIARPVAHDPKKQVPAMSPMNQSIDHPNVTTEPGAIDERQNRKLEMQLMPEALARAQYQERLREADGEREVSRFLLARRLQRRADRAQLRARRALAMAVMQ